MTENRRDRFTRRYEEKSTPWDTGITPPEIVAIVNELTPGRALDLGCGTGTNIRFLLEHGWHADGIDFVPQAIEIAQQKLADFPTDSFTVLCHDVTQLDTCNGLRPPYDLIYDIGCGHTLEITEGEKYARDIAALLADGGTFMLFAHQPHEERSFGWTPDDVERAFSPHFKMIWQALNNDTTTGYPAGWYRFTTL